MVGKRVLPKLPDEVQIEDAEGVAEIPTRLNTGNHARRRVVECEGEREGYFRLIRRGLILAAVAALFVWALLALPVGRLGDLDRESFDPACPPGLGRGIWDTDLFGEDEARGSREVRSLLDNPDFGASGEAAGDLRAGVVDPRLVETLRAVTREHRICVDAFKEGHYFIEGVEDGPRIPEGYGEAGGLPNTHYHGRAADIRYVDGKPVEGNGEDTDVLGVGRVLAGLPPQRRP
ncbi:MAG TPA: hypothetical protein VGP38_10260, partial [Rubrobacter sp.]|nr:hypothetical protein [Rubrobacter sp.]